MENSTQTLLKTRTVLWQTTSIIVEINEGRPFENGVEGEKFVMLILEV